MSSRCSRRLTPDAKTAPDAKKAPDANWITPRGARAQTRAEVLRPRAVRATACGRHGLQTFGVASWCPRRGPGPRHGAGRAAPRESGATVTKSSAAATLAASILAARCSQAATGRSSNAPGPAALHSPRKDLDGPGPGVRQRPARARTGAAGRISAALHRCHKNGGNATAPAQPAQPGVVACNNE